MQGINRTRHKALITLVHQLDEVLNTTDYDIAYDPSQIRQMEELLAHYEKLLEELQVCIGTYEELHKSVRFKTLAPLCRKLRKEGEELPQINGQALRI